MVDDDNGTVPASGQQQQHAVGTYVLAQSQYPWYSEQTYFEDPNPPTEPTPESTEEYYQNLIQYSRANRTFLTTEGKYLTGRLLWEDLCTVFRPGALRALHDMGNPGRFEIRAWRQLCNERNIPIPPSRGQPVYATLRKVWHETEIFPGLEEQELPAPAENSRAVEEEITTHAPNYRAGQEHLEEERYVEGAAVTPPRFNNRYQETRGDDGDENPFSSRQHATGSSRRPRQDSTPANPYALSSLSKLLIGRPKFAGEFDDDLAMTLQTYSVTARIANCNEMDKIAGFAMMLERDALRFFNENISEKVFSWDELTRIFINRFTSTEQRTRLFREFQGKRLSVELSASKPEDSERSVFAAMTARLRKIQRLLEPRYHSDATLKDQLIVSADIEKIQESFILLTPQTSAAVEERIQSFLSVETGSATRGGRGLAFLGYDYGSSDEEHCLYTTDQRFRGSAARRRPFRRPTGPTGKGRRIFRGDCWVCSAKHRAKDHHGDDEIRKALQAKKNRNAFLSVEEVADLWPSSVAQEAGGSSNRSEVEEGSDGDAGMVAWLETTEVVAKSLADRAFLAGVAGEKLQPDGESFGSSYETDLRRSLEKMEMDLRQGHTQTDSKFGGVLVDTGCNRSSIISLNELRNYASQYHVLPILTRDKAKTIRGIGSARIRTIGRATLAIPLPDLGISIDVEFSVVREPTTTLLSLTDMRKNHLDISILTNELIYGQRRQKLDTRNDQLWITWSKNDGQRCLHMGLLSQEEALKLHRSFGHASADKIANVIEKARPEENTGIRKVLKDIENACRTCQFEGFKPRRFKVTANMDEDLTWNHTIEVDCMWLDSKPVLHVVCCATKFQAAAFVNSMSTASIWKTLRRIWLHTYAGAPDIIRIDQGSNFVSSEFRRNCQEEGITIDPAPVECPTQLGKVERYHGPLRTTYNKTRRYEPDRDAALQQALHVLNTTVGPEGLVPALLVFGTIPRPARLAPAESQMRREQNLEAARKELVKYYAKEKLRIALKYRGPYGGEAGAPGGKLHDVQPGEAVRVYRPHQKKWVEYSYVSRDGDAVIVQKDGVRSLFSSTVVRKLTPDDVINIAALHHMFEDESLVLAATHPDEDKRFAESRRNEIDGLLREGVFEMRNRSEVPEGMRVYGSRFVDTIKADGTPKSRLVAQNYQDAGAATFPTKSPTVARATQRIALALAPTFLAQGRKLYMRDVRQAYTQSEDELQRPVYLRVSPIIARYLGIQDDSYKDIVLYLVRPLYGVPEAGLYWYCTYSKFHTEDLKLMRSKADKCLFHDRENCVILQVDDSLGIVSEEFLEREANQITKFRSQERQILADGGFLKFNGLIISRAKNCLFIRSANNVQNRKPAETDDEVRSVRASLQYVATCTRPDLIGPTQLLSTDVIAPTRPIFTRVNRLLSIAQETAQDGLRFPPLSFAELRLILMTDSSFGNAENRKSQIGYVLILCDNFQGSIVDYQSSRSRRVSRSVMGAELLALSHGFDRAYVCRYIIEDLLGRPVEMHSVVDSKTTFDLVTKMSLPMERRFSIDAAALQEAHESGELKSVQWAPREFNLADPLTHIDYKANSRLRKLMMTNELDLSMIGESITGPSI